MMKRYCMPVLLLSLLLNAGVIGTVLVRTSDSLLSGNEIRHGHTFLASYLKLDEEQLPRWRSSEHRFLNDLNSSWRRITELREQMIREIFSRKPNLSVIETQRQAIATLQAQQQQTVIQQLMKEREILNVSQRKTLADLLINQYPLGSLEQMLAEEVNRKENPQ